MSACSPSRRNRAPKPNAISRIGFDSCAPQNRPQPIWDADVAAKPELFRLIGDNIYVDTDDMNILRSKYERFAAIPIFAKLRETVPVLDLG